jgi:integrase
MSKAKFPKVIRVGQSRATIYKTPSRGSIAFTVAWYEGSKRKPKSFAGLRSAEIDRLDWSKVNFESGYITVDASIAKTNSRRLVPITDNLRAWLAPLAKKRGPVFDGQNLSRSIRVLVDGTRPEGLDENGERHEPVVKWKHNALRHSFCSYRLAKEKNAAQVSLEAGNSPQMIFKHYRELVTEAEATEWFGIMPDAGAEGKIVEMPSNKAALQVASG